MAVTGVADPDRLLRNDAALPGLPISLTKPIGVGVLNNRHKATGEVFPHAVASMVALNDVAERGGRRRGGAGGDRRDRVRAARATCSSCCAPRASGRCWTSAAVPVLDGAWESLRDGYVSGGTRRNLDWVRPHLDGDVSEDVLLMLADAQTSGGLLVVGEVPGAPVIGHTVAGPPRIEIR